jgi:hypothetical protein
MNADRTIKKLLMALHDLRQAAMFRAKVRTMLRLRRRTASLSAPPAECRRLHAALWKDFPVRHGGLWLSLYGNISGTWDHRFVPEPVYYTHIEPRLNNKAFSKAHTDKNFYSLLTGGLKTTVMIAANIEGVFTDAAGSAIDTEKLFDILGNHERFIVKPAVDSGGGRGVSLWHNSGGNLRSGDGRILTPTLLRQLYSKNFIIQEVLQQHPFFGGYNPSSVNTVRMLTYRSVAGESLHILHSVMRVGRSGSLTDNQAAGGYACAIAPDGCLTGRAVDKYGNVYQTINGIPLVEGTPVEGYEKMISTARALASRYRYARLLGLDLCLDNTGEVVVVEVNCLNNEINFFQMLGRPLFGEFTSEVVEWCASAPRSFLIDFDM